MTQIDLGLHMPSITKQILAGWGISDIYPKDVSKRPDDLCQRYQLLWGDTGGIGVSDSDGRCQVWAGYPNWWTEIPGMPKGREKRFLGVKLIV